jgi:TolB-like protein/Tfp pilus assembly protein PilF
MLEESTLMQHVVTTEPGHRPERRAAASAPIWHATRPYVALELPLAHSKILTNKVTAEFSNAGRSRRRISPPVTTSNNTVFLSYASEDSQAARRMCAALQARGIEVWFDQSDLRGGDVWDQRIRRQIKDCALFVPLVSANTLRRTEGYFRLEWRLADQRTHLMARNKVFIVPVAIDAMSDARGDVPESFTAVHWMRVLHDEARAAFVEHVWHLLSSDEHGAWTAAPAVGSSAALLAQSPPSALSLIPEKSIAVLPFADMSARGDQEYFSDGLAEALIDLLTQVRDLRVPARTSSFSFKGKSDDIATIAQKLRVAHVLEGSVRKAGHTIRITARLIRADNGYHLWSKTYDRKVEDIFKVQDEIAGIVVEALKAKLLPAQTVVNPHRTDVTEAYEHYLLAKQFYNRRAVDSAPRAAKALEHALALDPNYASAHVLLALTMVNQIAEDGDPGHVYAEQAVAAAEKAIALAPDFGEAYSARSYVRLRLRWDWKGAQADAEKALQLDPRSNEIQRRLSLLLGATGRFPEAIAAAQTATEIEPLDVSSWFMLGLSHAAVGESAAGLRALSHAVELSPESTLATLYLAATQLVSGQTTEALETNTRQQNEPWRWSILAMIEHTLEHPKESQRVLDELISKHGQKSPYRIAVAYAWRGEADSAFGWLQQAYRQRDAALSLLVIEPGLSGVRGDPRFKALLRKMHFPARRAGILEAR